MLSRSNRQNPHWGSRWGEKNKSLAAGILHLRINLQADHVEPRYRISGEFQGILMHGLTFPQARARLTIPAKKAGLRDGKISRQRCCDPPKASAVCPSTTIPAPLAAFPVAVPTGTLFSTKPSHSKKIGASWGKALHRFFSNIFRSSASVFSGSAIARYKDRNWSRQGIIFPRIITFRFCHFLVWAISPLYLARQCDNSALIPVSSSRPLHFSAFPNSPTTIFFRRCLSHPAGALLFDSAGGSQKSGSLITLSRNFLRA